MSTPPRDRNGFKIAVFCALPLEAESVQSVFDVCWEDQDVRYGKAPGDLNSYTTGLIEKHNVVLVHMPSIGGNSAALASAGLRSSFRRIELAFVVGICGVVPIHPTTGKEIILGDVIISTAVVQYDFGRQFPSGFLRKKETEDSLGRAIPDIRSFINMLTTRQNMQRFNKKFGRLVNSIEFGKETPAALYPGVLHDRLYEASYIHRHHTDTTCDECFPDVGTCAQSCDELKCGNERLVARNRHGLAGKKSEDGGETPSCIHLGRIGSANCVMRSGLDRDRISTADEIAAFEMEGAGVREQYSTIVIKGACDYADSHKNKIWQSHAAAMAAACLKVFLEEWVSTGGFSDQKPSFEPVWYVPFDAIPGFVGREVELQKLEQMLFDSKGRRIASLLGLGGVGKSRIALEFSYRILSKFPHYSVLWLQATDHSTFEKDMLEIGRKFRIPGIDDEKADVKSLVKQYLSHTTKRKWLLVLDNADDDMLWGRRSKSKDQDSSLIEYLPKTTNGSILVTTRTRQVASFLAEKELVNLGTMTQDCAIELFVSKLGDPNLKSDSLLLSNLVNKLANIPLAIVQAAAYINMTEISLQAYLDLLDQPESEVVRLLSKDFGDASRYVDAANSIATTWLISFEYIRKRHVIAASFLSTMACLHEKGIPFSLLPDVDAKFDRIEALSILTGYSFVTKQSRSSFASDEGELYDIHRLVGISARNWLEESRNLSHWISNCVTKLLRLLPDYSYEHKLVWATYLPHVQRLCENNKEEICPEQFELLEKLSLYLVANGKYSEAIKFQSIVVEWRERTLKESDSLIFIAYDLLGYALTCQGDYSKAEYYLTAAVEGLVVLLGKDSLQTLDAMSHLAILFDNQSKYIEAERLQCEVLQRSEILLSKNHPWTLTAMSLLAAIASSRGNYFKSESIQREALQLKRKMLGEAHPDTISTMVLLAQLLGHIGKYIEMEEMSREGLQLSENVLGNSHLTTLRWINALARALCFQGKLLEAETIQRKGLQLSTLALGESHSITLGGMDNLAEAFKMQDRYMEAEEIYRKALRMAESALSESHDITLTIANNLAEVLRERGKYDEMESIQRKTVQSSIILLGEGHPSTLCRKHNLAMTLHRQGCITEVAEMMRSNAAKAVEVLGSEHPLTQRLCRNLNAWRESRPSGDQQEEEDDPENDKEGLIDKGKERDDEIVGIETLKMEILNIEAGESLS